jgi:hypothetical protein
VLPKHSDHALGVERTAKLIEVALCGQFSGDGAEAHPALTLAAEAPGQSGGFLVCLSERLTAFASAGRFTHSRAERWRRADKGEAPGSRHVRGP